MSQNDEKAKQISRTILLLVAFALIVLSSFMCGGKRPVVGGSQTAHRAELPPPPHEVTDIHGAGSKSIWYFIVVPKATSADELSKIAEYYVAKHPDALVLNVHIFCDRKYASYATGIESSIPDREDYSHVLVGYMTGKIAQAHGPIDQPGLGSACGK